MNEDQFMKLIYRAALELFPEATEVEITVDGEGVKMKPCFRLVGPCEMYAQSQLTGKPCSFTDNCAGNNLD